MKEFFLNRVNLVVVLLVLAVALFSFIVLMEENYKSASLQSLHYILLAAVYITIAIYAAKKIAAARKEAAKEENCGTS